MPMQYIRVMVFSLKTPSSAGIGKVKFDGGEFVIGDGQTGPVTARLRQALVGLQGGQSQDPYGWVHPVLVG